MKRLVFKDWVTYTLSGINLIAFIVMGSDCNDIKLFILSHMAALVIFLINCYLIMKYGKKMD